MHRSHNVETRKNIGLKGVVPYVSQGVKVFPSQVISLEDAQAKKEKNIKMSNFKLKIANAAAAILHLALALWVIIDGIGNGNDWIGRVIFVFEDWVKTNSSFSCRVEGNCFTTVGHKRLPNGGKVSLSGVVAAFHLMSSAFQASAIIPWRRWWEQKSQNEREIHFKSLYIESIRSGVNPFRWVEYSISAPTMIIAISIILGESSLSAIILSTSLTSVMMFMGFLQECVMSYFRVYKLENKNDAFKTSSKNEEIVVAPKWVKSVLMIVPHLAGWVCFAGLWASLGTTFFSTINLSSSKPPSDIEPIIYTVFWSMFFLFGSFGVVQTIQLVMPSASPFYIEIAYTCLSFVSKTILGILIYSGTMARDRMGLRVGG